MANSRRVPNINGAADSYLKVVSKKDGAASQFSSAVKSAPKAQQQLVQNVLNAVRASISDSDAYQLNLDSRTADVVLGRIASLLDEVKDKFVETELAEAKQEILDEISGLSVESVLKNFLLSQIAELFDDDAKKEDIEDLKAFIAEKLNVPATEAKAENAPELEKEAGKEGQTFRDKEVDSLKDESVGEYKDSTIAKNFTTLQNAIQQQIDILNANIAAIPGGIGLGKIAKFVGTGVVKTLNAIGKLGSKVSSFAKKSLVGIGKVGAVLAGGAFKGIVKTLGFIKSGIGKVGSLVGKVAGGVVNGLKSVSDGIKGIGSKVGGAILHPFKAIGGFFSRKKKDKAAEKKEKLREKFMNFIIGMVEKIWDFVEPILSKLKIFMLLALVPILTTAITIISIVAGLTLLLVGAYLVYKWIKKKALELWNYISSGEMLDDIIAGLKKAWEWLCDFGKWLWDLTIKALKYIFVDVWVDLGKWLWEKLCDFGNWLYNEFIYPWIVAPIELLRNKLTTFLEPIMKKLQPFIESAQNLFARIKDVWQKFQWDENKSFFENLKCLASIVKDAVLDWWNTSPFKTFYETYLEPIVKSVQNLIERIKTIWKNFHWNENKSFFENLKCLASIIINAVKSWWNDPDNPIRKLYNEYIKPIVDKIADTISPVIEKISNKAKEILNKLGNAVWDVPVLPLMRPFGFLVGKSILLSKEEKENKKLIESGDEQDIQEKINHYQREIDKGNIKGDGWDNEARLNELKNALAAKRQPSLAQQQVQNALGPVNSLNNMNADTNVELQKTGEEMSNKAAAAEQATEDYREQQTMLGSQYLAEMQDMRKEMREGFKDPSVVPVYVPSQSRSAALPMRRF